MRQRETLVMPSNYVVMTEEEMCYLEGGKRLYYAGINSTKKWSKYKWQARAAAVGLGKGYGAVFMLGLENKMYDMISGR